MLGVTLLHVICHFFFGEASRWRVCYQRGLPHQVYKIQCKVFITECVVQLQSFFVDRLNPGALSPYGTTMAILK